MTQRRNEDGHAADYCGYAWYTENDNTYIEVYKGDFTPVLNAETLPSYYVLHRDGSLRSGEERVMEEEEVVLSQARMDEICALLASENPDRLKRKIAWIILGDDLLLQEVILPFGPRVTD